MEGPRGFGAPRHDHEFLMISCVRELALFSVKIGGKVAKPRTTSGSQKLGVKA